MKSNHWRELESKVIQYRYANSELELDVSNGWRERLWNDVCEQAPHIEFQHVNEPPFSMSLDNARRALMFSLDFVQSGGQLVSQEEADSRASICMTGANGKPCPHNKILDACWGCKGLSKILRAVIGDKKTPHDPKLESCEACGGCSLKEKVWIPSEALHTEGMDFPQYCWQRKVQ